MVRECAWPQSFRMVYRRHCSCSSSSPYFFFSSSSSSVGSKPGVKLAEGLALQDSEEYLAAVARNYASESDGAWTYTRQAIAGKTTGNPDVDAILFLWVKKQQEGPDEGNITAYLL